MLQLADPEAGARAMHAGTAGSLWRTCGEFQVFVLEAAVACRHIYLIDTPPLNQHRYNVVFPAIPRRSIPNTQIILSHDHLLLLLLLLQYLAS